MLSTTRSDGSSTSNGSRSNSMSTVYPSRRSRATTSPTGRRGGGPRFRTNGHHNTFGRPGPGRPVPVPPGGEQLAVPSRRGERGEAPLDQLVGTGEGSGVGWEAARDRGVDRLSAQLPVLVAAGQGAVEDHVGDERPGAGEGVQPGVG